jgi:hypothetical protein
VVDGEYASREVREGVRSGILSSIQLDVEMRGGRTARLLVAAGVVGVVGAVGVTLLISGHPFGHHPPWHVAVISMVWTGLLVVGFAIAFLGVRTPALPLARSALVGILGLGLAGICGALCPDQHFLNWWSETGIGSLLTAAGGLVRAANGALRRGDFRSPGPGRTHTRKAASPGCGAAPPARTRRGASVGRHLARRLRGVARRSRRGSLRWCGSGNPGPRLAYRLAQELKEDQQTNFTASRFSLPSVSLT